ncbi:hypothetical protein LIER_41972 [Lithospermum erythrorhizon]|uniref:VQ domain-containing protein n=1 Tax=Lithospermum erythrorhizon TaxID=34254 RepID=A0AAV3RKM5_LITER
MDNIHRVVPKSMSRSKGKKSKQQNSVKVVYISTPMKVKTSASQFRTLVQELTGRDSDIARLMMESNDQEYGVVGKEFDGFDKGLRSFVEKQEEKSPTDSNSECLSDNLDGIFSSQEQSFVEEQLMFDLDFVFNSSEIDVLGSYDAL